MANADFDLFVIGAGSAGVRAARFAADRGARVALAESGPLGGTCVNAGCIPKRLLSYAAELGDDFALCRAYGWGLDSPSFDWATLIANKDAEIRRLNEVYAGLLKRSGVSVVHGRAKLVDAHRIAVAGKTYSARSILIATGGKPQGATFAGSEFAITSNEAFHLPELPKRIVIVGAGYIAVEFASIFAGLGREVTLLVRGERILKNFDLDIGPFLARELVKRGITIRFKTSLREITRGPAEFSCETLDGERLTTDLVMLATGRVPNTADLGLESAGIDLRPDGSIAIDATYRTGVPSIFAVGDVIGRVQLTPVALAEAMIAVEHILGRSTQRAINYDEIATAVFSHPNVGTVGLTEELARGRGHKISIFRSEFTSLRNTLPHAPERTLMKLVVDAQSDRVLGAHMVGANAGDIIQGIAVALRCKVRKADFDETIGIHPTLAEEFVTMREAVKETDSPGAADLAHEAPTQMP